MFFTNLQLELKAGLSIISFIIVAALSAQIVDDSTKLVYGPRTTEIIYLNDLKDNLNDLKDNLPTVRKVDTSLTCFENYEKLDLLGHKYQNLGNNGTAISPIFYQLPISIGKTSGYAAYDLYFKTPEDIKYYDTKSPFMDVYTYFGGRSRAKYDFTFTVNVNPQWNFGFDFHRIATDKQIGAEQSKGDVNVRSSLYDFFLHYNDDDKPYKMMASFTGFSHKVDETGGVRVTSENPLEFEYFQYQDSDIFLEDANSQASINSMHLYQQYQVLKQFQLYHQFDRKVRKYIFNDYEEEDEPYREFYPKFLIVSDSTTENAVFTSISNEVGIKGTLSTVFYRFYVRRRDTRMTFQYNNAAGIGENYLGGITRFDWRGYKVEAKAEVLPTGEFLVKGEMDSPFLNASYKTIRYKPSYLADQYSNNLHDWSNNNFTQGFGNELKGRLKLKIKDLNLTPSLSLTTFDEFLYFERPDTLTEVHQATGTALMTQIGGGLDYFLPTDRSKNRGFHLKNELYFTNIAGAASSKIQVPGFLYSGRLYWGGIIFKESVPFQVGMDVHGRSSYFANDYDPAIQQFFVQTSNKIKGYNQINAFVNMRIDKVFIFLKWVHLNQRRNDGYFVTPLYPGQGNVVDMGVRWLFFD